MDLFINFRILFDRNLELLIQSIFPNEVIESIFSLDNLVTFIYLYILIHFYNILKIYYLELFK